MKFCFSEEKIFVGTFFGGGGGGGTVFKKLFSVFLGGRKQPVLFLQWFLDSEVYFLPHFVMRNYEDQQMYQL